ncbi:MAG: alpha/beta hydrolase [Candidatus Dormibacteria bacterium]
MEPRTTHEEAGWRKFLGLAPGTEPAPEVRSLLDFHRRPGVPRGARFHDGVEFGRAGMGGRALRMWLFSRGERSRRQPGVVFVHSGGWFQGTPFVHMRHAYELAQLGYVTATIEYRLEPEGTVWDALADTKCAVRYMRANAAELGLDGDRLAIAGGSAGGHLAAMTAMTPGRYEGAGGNHAVSSAVQAVMMLYPMVDLRACTGILVESIARIVGPDPAVLDELSPITHVRPGVPPVLTINGDPDSLTPLAMSQRFHRELEAAGVFNRLVVLPGQEHGFDISPAGWQLSFDPMVSFLGEVFAGAGER